MTEQDKALNELSELLDTLQKELVNIQETLSKKPRELMLYYNDYAQQWKEVVNIHDVIMAKDSNVQTMYIREIL